MALVVDTHTWMQTKENLSCYSGGIARATEISSSRVAIYHGVFHHVTSLVLWCSMLPQASQRCLERPAPVSVLDVASNPSDLNVNVVQNSLKRRLNIHRGNTTLRHRGLAQLACVYSGASTAVHKRGNSTIIPKVAFNHGITPKQHQGTVVCAKVFRCCWRRLEWMLTVDI